MLILGTDASVYDPRLWLCLKLSGSLLNYTNTEMMFMKSDIPEWIDNGHVLMLLDNNRLIKKSISIILLLFLSTLYTYRYIDDSIFWLLNSGFILRPSKKVVLHEFCIAVSTQNPKFGEKRERKKYMWQYSLLALLGS